MHSMVFIVYTVFLEAKKKKKKEKEKEPYRNIELWLMTYMLKYLG